MKGHGESPLGVPGPEMGMEPVRDCKPGAKASPPEGYRSIKGGSWLWFGWTVLALLKESCDT